MDLTPDHLGTGLWKLKGIRQAGGRGHRLSLDQLEISQGITAIVGQSGSGKTSLMNLLVGYEKADSGEVLMARHFSQFWKPQDDGLWQHVNVHRHLEISQPAGVNQNQVDELLKQFDLEHRAKARPNELSQGERARLSVARAIITGVEVLVMDEALEHVDEARKEAYWSYLLQHIKEVGGSLVYATHDPDRVLGVADEVICMADGKVLVQGSTHQIYFNPPSQEAMRCLGQGNWITDKEAEELSKDHEIESGALRPQQVEVLRDEAGTYQVLDSQQGGMMSRTTLAHAESESTRSWIHVTREFLKPGDRASLRFLKHRITTILMLYMLSVMSLGLTACGESSAETLVPEEIREWNMPLNETSLPAPRGASVSPDGDLYVIDKAGRVIVFDTAGEVLRSWWMPEYEAGRAESILVMKDGNIAVADTHYFRVVIFDPQGKVIRMFGSKGKQPGQFIYPVGLAQDEEGHLFVSEYGGNDRIQKFTPEGEYLLGFGSFGTAAGQMMRTAGIAWQDGIIYVADAGSNRISIFEDTGKFIGFLGDGIQEASKGVGKMDLSFFDAPFDIETFGKDFCYIVCQNSSRLWRVSLDGQRLGSFGSVGSGITQTKTPWGIAASPTGDKVFIMDTGNRRVLELTWSQD